MFLPFEAKFWKELIEKTRFICKLGIFHLKFSPVPQAGSTARFQRPGSTGRFHSPVPQTRVGNIEIVLRNLL